MIFIVPPRWVSESKWNVHYMRTTYAQRFISTGLYHLYIILVGYSIYVKRIVWLSIGTDNRLSTLIVNGTYTCTRTSPQFVQIRIVLFHCAVVQTLRKCFLYFTKVVILQLQFLPDLHHVYMYMTCTSLNGKVFF